MNNQIKIIDKFEEEMNEFYDGAKAANGGGYHQPYVEIDFNYDGREFHLTHYNQSCGDFGRRYYTSISEIIESEEREVYYYDCDYVGDDYVTITIDDSFKGIYKEISDSDELGEYFPWQSLEEIEEDIKLREERLEHEWSQTRVLTKEEFSSGCSGSEEIEEDCEED